MVNLSRWPVAALDDTGPVASEDHRVELLQPASASASRGHRRERNVQP
jgi:hypothetical protein